MLKIAAEYDKKKSEDDEKKAPLSINDAKLKKRGPPAKKKDDKKTIEEEVEIPPPIRYLDPVEISDLKLEEQTRQFQVNIEAHNLVQIRDSYIKQKIESKFLTLQEKRKLSFLQDRELIQVFSQLWTIIEKQSNSNSSYSTVAGVFRKIWTFFLPQFAPNQIHLISDSFLSSLATEKMTEYTQKEFYEVLIHLGDVLLEKNNVENMAALFRYLLNALTFTQILNLNGENNPLEKTLEITFYSTSKINERLASESSFTPQQSNVLYCQEKYSFSLSTLAGVYNQCEFLQFLEDKDIIPLGRSSSQVLTNLINNQEIENRRVKIFNKEHALVFLKEQQNLFYSGFLITDDDGFEIRLNPGLFLPHYFEPMEMKDGSTKICNLRSIYGEESSIDKVKKLKKRWVNSQEPPEPSALELQDKLPQEVLYLLIQNKFRLNNFHEDLSKYEELVFSTSDRFNQIESEPLDVLSSRENLPQDTLRPYEEDVIEYAKESSLKVLVHGLPKIGKSRFCKKLAESLDLEYLDQEAMILNLLTRTTEGEENVEMDDDDKPIEFLTPVERRIVTALRDGGRISYKDEVEFFEQEAKKMRLDQKGFVFEAQAYEAPASEESILEKILSNKIRLAEIGDIVQEPFNFVIDLKFSDQDMLLRASTILENNDPENWKLTSDLDRFEIDELKKKAIFMNSEEYEAPADGEEEEILDPEEIKVLTPNNLFQRMNEDPWSLRKIAENYRLKVLPVVESLGKKIHVKSKIVIDYATLTVDQAISQIKGAIGEKAVLLRPIAKILEDAPEEDYTSLPMFELEGETGDVPRRWSIFRNIDPVAYNMGEIKKGLSERSVEYAGRIFVFSSDENQKLFCHNPKPYLREQPVLNTNYNISLLGLSKSGKTTMAQRLAKTYGLKVFEFQSYFKQKIAQYMANPEHVPSNPEQDNILFSKTDFDSIMNGKGFDKKLLLPMLLHDAGIKLYIKPPPPKDEDDADLDDDDRKARDEERRRKDEENQKKKKKKVEEVKPEEEKITKLPDIPLIELVPKPDEVTKIVPSLKGYIFIDFPTSEEEVNYLKDLNITLNKCIILKEDEETGDGGSVSKRGKYLLEQNLEQDIQNLTTTVDQLKENLSDDVLQEVTISSIEETFSKLIQIVDPFSPTTDSENFQLAVDNGEDGDVIPFGVYGNYCPVTLVDEGWLVLGSEEFEVQVRGRRYRFYTEEFMKKFQSNIKNYLQELVQPPPPRIFMIGCSGSGLKTQLALLHEKSTLPIVDFLQSYRTHSSERFLVRRRNRRLRRKGKELDFEPPVEDSEEEYNESSDEELQEEDENFEKDKYEIDLVNTILGLKNGKEMVNKQLIDLQKANDKKFQEGTKAGPGRYLEDGNKLSIDPEGMIVNLRMDDGIPEKDIEFDFGQEEEEVEEGKDNEENEEESQRIAKQKAKEQRREEKLARKKERSDQRSKELPEADVKTLLQESRKLPEILILLKPNKLSFLARKFNQNKVKKQHQAILDQLENKKREKREKFEEKRASELQRLLDEGEEVNPEEFMPFDPSEVYASIPEPPDLNEELQKEKDRILEAYEEQIAKNDAIKEELEGIGVKVVSIKSDYTIERVFQKIKHVLEDFLRNREAILTRHMAYQIKDSENDAELTIEKKLTKLKKSYYYKESRYAGKNALDPSDVKISKKFPVVFLNRIYYLQTQEQVNQVLKNPLKLLFKPQAQKLISNTSSTGTKYYHLEVETEKFTSKDVFCRPRMALIGKYKSGKSSVALEASQLSGSVLIRIPEIIELFLKNRFSGLGRKLNTILRGGKQVPDDLLAELLALRLKMEDCSQNGWLLDGFPQTQEQAIQMYKKGVYPDLIFSDPIPEIFVRQRTNRFKDSLLFKYDQEVVDTRLRESIPEVEKLENMFSFTFNNLRLLTKPSVSSKAYQILDSLKSHNSEKMLAITAFNSQKAFLANCLNIKSHFILENLSESLNFNPVSYKNKTQYIACTLNKDPLIYFDRKFYLVKNQDDVAKFLNDPEYYKNVDVQFDKLPKLTTIQQAKDCIRQYSDSNSERHKQIAEYRGFCPVSLFLGELNPGIAHISLTLNHKIYWFASGANMRTFYKNPSIFSRVKLPLKLEIPVPTVGSDPKTLKDNSSSNNQLSVKNSLKKDLNEQSQTSISEKEKLVQDGAFYMAKNLKARTHSDRKTLLMNELGELLVKAMNQLSCARVKYPGISEKSTSLKMIALYLKASNPSKTQEERKKYKTKLKSFLNDCLIAKQIIEEKNRRSND